METRLKPNDAVDEGNGDGIGVKVGVEITTGVKLAIGVEDSVNVKVGETAVRSGAHVFTMTARRTSLGNDASFFKSLSPFNST